MYFINGFVLMIILNSLLSVRSRTIMVHSRDPAILKKYDETKPFHWFDDSMTNLRTKLQQTHNKNIAKNVIIIVGDGMSLTTIAATRVYIGHKKGILGEESKLSFEEFPYSGLIKTYCVDRQVADSACSATAYLCGVKANMGTMGVSAAVKRNDCAAQSVKANQLRSIAGWAQDAGKKTGFVTTTRVTHASPGGLYANTANRAWEADAMLLKTKVDSAKCDDIAKQLVYGDVGSNLDVILGGGRENFLPYNTSDPLHESSGVRLDGRNLIDEWIKNKQTAGKKPSYLKTLRELQELNLNDVDSVLGLFENSHLKYHLDSNKDDPNLTDMATTAIKLLNHDAKKGFFLFIEGGKIDIAHHETKARKALDETAQLSKTVEEILKLVDLNETLVIVTADHSHTMSYSGYNKRGSDILGYSQNNAEDGMPYMILNYANGPGYRQAVNNTRHNFLTEDIHSSNYTFPSLIPLKRETHGGEDVAIFAIGPWAHLFTGTNEQTFIPYAAAYASCMGKGFTACDHLGFS